MERVPIRLGHQRTTLKNAPRHETEILTSESSHDTGLYNTTRVCRVCTSHISRYTCPRCNVPYCGLECYRTHGSTCTEMFYQEHVTNEIAFDDKITARNDPMEQRKRETGELLERVKQFHDECALDDAAVLTAERLEQLSLLDTSEWSLDCLTEEERAQFLADVETGRIAKLVEPWEPWWIKMSATVYEHETNARRKQLIQEVNEENKEVESEMITKIEAKGFPNAIFTSAIEQTIPKSCFPVSPCLKFHLIEILYAHVLVLRLYNGDWQHDVIDATLSLLQASSVLCDDQRFSSLESVVQCCLEKRCIDGGEQVKMNHLILSDIVTILIHRMFGLDLFTDMIAMITTCQQDQMMKKQHKKLMGIVKKIEFYRLWWYHVPFQDMTMLSHQLASMF